jgi:hypothetical protein
VGEAKEPAPVKLIMPMLTVDLSLFEVVERRLRQHFGPTDYVSETLPFEHTAYYEPEFGPGLKRRFYAYRDLIDPGSIAQIKRLTNEIESEWQLDGRRRINLDPGYVSRAKLVLATTKNHGHRIYVGQGIYAEVTLIYRDRDFRPFPWTYPDYASEPYRQILREVRAIYTSQLKALGL